MLLAGKHSHCPFRNFGDGGRLLTGKIAKSITTNINLVSGCPLMPFNLCDFNLCDHESHHPRSICYPASLPFRQQNRELHEGRHRVWPCPQLHVQALHGGLALWREGVEEVSVGCEVHVRKRSVDELGS